MFFFAIFAVVPFLYLVIEEIERRRANPRRDRWATRVGRSARRSNWWWITPLAIGVQFALGKDVYEVIFWSTPLLCVAIFMILHEATQALPRAPGAPAAPSRPGYPDSAAKPTTSPTTPP